MAWHLDKPAAEAYPTRSTDGAVTASIEAHLVSCSNCQALMATIEEPAMVNLVADVWANVDELLDRRRIPVVERALRRFGCTETTARIMSVSARARWSYLAAVAVSVGMAFVAARSGNDRAFEAFLLLAPVGPLVATLGSFNRRTDPLHSLMRSVPTSPWRIAVLRTIASVVPAIGLTAIGVPILYHRGWLAAAWLLPSLALGMCVLALATRIAIESATLIAGACWLSVPLWARLHQVDLLRAFGGQIQFAALAVIAVITVALAVHRDRLDELVMP